ncbi:response regulator [Labilibacter sediminis]|nr:response regulator [Labilibacter sediminis]
MNSRFKGDRYLKIQFLILVMIWSLIEVRAQNYIYNFSKVVDRTDHSPMISNIIQDPQGFIWYTSVNQLSCYDGVQHKHFDIGFNVSEARMDEDIIKQVVSTKEGLIWGATGVGLFCFDTKTHKSFFLSDHLTNRDIEKYIVGVQKGKNDDLYFSTKSKLYRLQYNTKSVLDTTRIKLDVIESWEEEAYNLHVNEDEITIYTNLGVKIINASNNIEKTFKWKDASLKNIKVTTVYYSDDHILVGSLNNGILIFNRNWTLENHLTLKDYSALLSNSIDDIHQSNNIIWFGTPGGLGQIHLKGDQVKVTNHSMLLFKHVKHRNIHSLFEDKNGVLWIGTYSDGLLKMVSSPVFYRFLGKVKFTNAIPYMGVGVQIHMDNNGDIYYLNDNKLELFKHDGDKKTLKFSNRRIHCFLLDGQKIWIADSSGTFLYDLNEDLNLSNKKEIEFLKGVKVSEIVKDKTGAYWVASFNNQTFKFSFENEEIVSYKEMFKPNKSYYLPQSIKPLANGDVLLYLIQKGLYRYKHASDELEKIDLGLGNENGLTSFSCIEEDLEGNIWLGGRKNIYIYLAETGKTITYPHDIPGMVFNLITDKNGDTWGVNRNRLFKIDKDTRKIEYLHNRIGDYEFNFYMNRGKCLSNGDIALCMTNGSVLIVHPNLLNERIKKPDNNIVSVKINNKELEVGDYTALKNKIETNISYLNNLVLSHQEKNVSIGFATSDFSDPENVQYFYRLKGVGEEWNSAFSGNNIINYSNLTPGKYTFQVKASYADIDNAGNTTELFIKVKHPWYANIWAYIIYGIIVAVVVYIILKYAFDIFKLNQQISIERFKHEKENELNQMKLQFFTNISHEFKTPLTLLVGPLKSLLDGQADENKRKNLYHLMYRNTERLMRLINQLMDFRKISNKKYDLRIVHNDMCLQLNNLIEAFTKAAENKKISLKVQMNDTMFCWYDPDVLDKVVSNLLSNALKHTGEKGQIFIRLEKINDNIKLSVKDSGTGISPEELPHIFDRFYQAKSSPNSSDSMKGTGIGLALTKELILLHKGTIDVKSEIGKGTYFEVNVPVTKEAFLETEVYSELSGAFIQKEEVAVEPSEDIAEVREEDSHEEKQKTTEVSKTLLVVEDDHDLRGFVVQYLSGFYKVKQAENGKEGLEMAKKVLPDLVISDVMMPEMDGLDFCRKLKTDVEISHIPVVLLTAKTQLEQQIEGIKIGADAYITKPFDPQYLSSVIANLIAGRQKLREKWDRKFIELTPSELAMTNADEIFLDKVIAIVEENISNPDFKLEDIYESIGMGRTLFLQKVKALTNQTCGDFVRSLRLKRAAFLLENHEVRISDLCYDVGFNDPKYFGKVFKKYYGSSPSEYARLNKGNKKEEEQE